MKKEYNMTEETRKIAFICSKGDIDKEMTLLHQLLARGVDGLLVEPAGGFQSSRSGMTTSVRIRERSATAPGSST